MADARALAEQALAGRPLDRGDAARLAESAGFEELLSGANRIREHYCGSSVRLCSIINAKSGACREDCAFCAQSARHAADIAVYPLVSAGRMAEAAGEAARAGADSFGIVTSGGGPEAEAADFDAICHAAGAIARSNAVRPCVSIGKLAPADAARLRSAGVLRVNHNLETSERFYPEICTTHTHADRVETVRAAKDAGLEVCSGGIFGMGETWADRIDLALALRRLDVDSVPVNFLNPVPGTPLGSRPLVEPREALRIIALFRYLLPDKTIKVCGGREVTLRDMQSWMFRAGASGTMIGNYLTTAGRSAEDDLQMLADLGLTPASECE